LPISSQGAAKDCALSLTWSGRAAVMPAFLINSARSSLIASVDLHATFVGGKFLLINIFVHVSFGTFPRIKLNYYFYVSEPSPSDCQRPGIA